MGGRARSPHRTTFHLGVSTGGSWGWLEVLGFQGLGIRGLGLNHYVGFRGQGLGVEGLGLKVKGYSPP